MDMKNLHKPHRWAQAFGLAVLIALIWEGAGADLTRGGMGLIPQSNPLFRVPGLRLDRPQTLSDRQRATSLTEARIRLFSQRKVSVLAIQSDSGILVSGRRFQGKVNFSVNKGKILLAHRGKIISRSSTFVIRPQ